MLTDYVRHLVFTYIANIVRRVNRRQPQAGELVEWINDNIGLLELDEEGLNLPLDFRSDSVPPDKVWKRLRRVASAKRKVLKGTPPDRLCGRLARLGEMIGLTEEDVAILEVLLRYETHPVVEDLIDSVFSGKGFRLGRALNLRHPSLPTLLGMSANDVRRRFAAVEPLVRTGLVEVEDDQDVSCVGRLHRLASVVDESADVRELLLGDTRDSELEWTDFDHLGQSRDDVESLLRGALERRARGVNILVYGPPGTGKTEFCRVLARRMGVELLSVGEADESGDEPTRRERLGELRLAQCLLGEDRGTLLLFDEMEDLLADGGLGMFFGGLFDHRRHGGASKVFMNRLLEETPAPTLWTTNIAESINPAILRRMMFALEMRQPPPKIRSRIWSRQLARHGIEAMEADAAALAHEFDASPGVAAGATAAADLADGDYDTVRRGIRSLSRVLGCDRPEARPTIRFDPALIEADLDVETLARCVWRRAPSGGSRSVCRGRRGRARARTCAILPTASVSR